MKPALLLLCCTLPFCNLTGSAQAPPSDTQTTQALLAEVHQLRVTLERSTLIGPRIQIAVERLKLQQDQVARIARQLDDIRRDLDGVHSAQARTADRLKELDSASTQSVDPNERKALGDELRQFKSENERLEKSEQQMRAREGEVGSALQAEQNKLNELNDRLDQIERALNVP